MNFTKTFGDIQCNCVEGSNEDTNNNYALKTIKENLRIQDFYSYHEKGKTITDTKCDNICSFRGVSVSLYNEETEENVLKLYKELFPLSPGYKPYLKIIKFGENCGKVKHTPSNNNDYHFDFYKCDTFAIDKIEVIEVKELHNV
ncbi:hypothetical protein [Empedobacter brevis]|uniref:hypothetical protein n=1 Tax=Empedobacter brevis TaxID=247 RepID=UPI0028964A93|nr:hypothetical protein [Empedobacter brevis]